jgi:hypothetical protein
VTEVSLRAVGRPKRLLSNISLPLATVERVSHGAHFMHAHLSSLSYTLHHGEGRVPAFFATQEASARQVRTMATLL